MVKPVRSISGLVKKAESPATPEDVSRYRYIPPTTPKVVLSKKGPVDPEFSFAPFEFSVSHLNAAAAPLPAIQQFDNVPDVANGTEVKGSAIGVGKGAAGGHCPLSQEAEDKANTHSNCFLMF